MSETVSDQWTELVSEAETASSIYTIEVEDADIYLAETSGSAPAEAEKGITARASEATVVRIEGRALYAKRKASVDATVRVVPGVAKTADGRASVDVTSRPDRNLGQVRLLDQSGTLVDADNPAHRVRPNLPNTEFGQVTGHAGGSYALNGGTSVSVPNGYDVVVKALPDNTDIVTVGIGATSDTDGFVLSPGDSVSLGVDDADEIEMTPYTSGEGVCWIVETEGGTGS